MKDYYRTLGVERNATEEDIRKAYRSLALRFHPDVNRDPSAIEQFREVNEAYEVLIDSQSRSNYDQGIHFELPRAPHPDPAYNPAYRSRGSGEPTIKELMRDHLSWVKWGSRIALVLFAVLLADFIIPAARRAERITRIENVYLLTRSGRVMVFDHVYQITETGRQLEVTRSFEELRGDSRVVIALSRVFSIPRRVSIEGSDVSEKLGGTVFGNWIFLPALLGIFAVAGVMGPENLEWRFNAGIASYLLTLLNVIFLVFSINAI